MRCVKDTLPPRARDRWLLMTMRLSHSSLTGTARTLVAVGTVREASMLAAVRAGAPRRIVWVASALGGAGSAGLDSFGTGVLVPFAGSAALVSGRGFATGAGAAAFAGASVVCFASVLGAMAGPP